MGTLPKKSTSKETSAIITTLRKKGTTCEKTSVSKTAPKSTSNQTIKDFEERVAVTRLSNIVQQIPSFDQGIEFTPVQSLVRNGRRNVLSGFIRKARLDDCLVSLRATNEQISSKTNTKLRLTFCWIGLQRIAWDIRKKDCPDEEKARHSQVLCQADSEASGGCGPRDFTISPKITN